MALKPTSRFRATEAVTWPVLSEAYLRAVGGQTRTAKKVLTHALPAAVVDEELLQRREPFAVTDREIAGLKLVAQLE